jgi:hypothetical protein
MAELGQTADPRALIPGAPEVIEADANALLAHGQRTEQVGQGLKRVDVGNWAGAAGTGFADTWSKEPPKWLKVADSIGATTGAMTTYAGTLRWAQDQAGGAIQLWNNGAAATTRAYLQYQAVAADAAARNVAVGPFVDPGDRYRRQAQDLLSRARQQLKAAGDQAAWAIGGMSVGTPGAGLRSGGTLNSLVDAVTDGWTANGQVARNGPNTGASVSMSQSGKLAELKAYAQLGGAAWTGSVRNGSLALSGKGEFDIGAQAAATASFGGAGYKAKAELSAAARAAVEGHADYGQVGVYGRAAGSAGVEASAAIQAGEDGVVAGVGAFAGVKGEVAGGAEVGGIAAGATAEGWVGAGFEAKFGFGEGEDGKFHLGGNVGAAVGVGGEVGFEVTVDPEKVEQTAREAADAIGTGAQAVGHAAEDVGQAVGVVADSVDDSVGDIAKHLNLIP